MLDDGVGRAGRQIQYGLELAGLAVPTREGVHGQVDYQTSRWLASSSLGTP